MKKVLCRLFLVLIVSGLLVSGLVVKAGYDRYREVTKDYPITAAVRQYHDMQGYVEFERIDQDFVEAVVAVEDQRFFQRTGVDYIALGRAVLNNLIYKDAHEGGSTISQQIAKNLYFQLFSRGLEEKVAEIFIMKDLEAKYTKTQLFALYANMNYYGDGYWGYGAACRGYYDAEPDELTVGQAAMLAGIPNAPSLYQLSTGYDLALQRQRLVLQRMYVEGYLSEEEYNNACNDAV